MNNNQQPSATSNIDLTNELNQDMSNYDSNNNLINKRNSSAAKSTNSLTSKENDLTLGEMDLNNNSGIFALTDNLMGNKFYFNIFKLNLIIYFLQLIDNDQLLIIKETKRICNDSKLLNKYDLNSNNQTTTSTINNNQSSTTQY